MKLAGGPSVSDQVSVTSKPATASSSPVLRSRATSLKEPGRPPLASTTEGRLANVASREWDTRPPSGGSTRKTRSSKATPLVATPTRAQLERYSGSAGRSSWTAGRRGQVDPEQAVAGAGHIAPGGRSGDAPHRFSPSASTTGGGRVGHVHEQDAPRAGSSRAHRDLGAGDVGPGQVARRTDVMITFADPTRQAGQRAGRQRDVARERT